MEYYPIIDTHAHLWLKQDAVVEGKAIRTLTGGRSEFMGEIRQMIPPFLIDGRNSAEVFLSNMDYALVSAAVITQEFIDGPQNAYLTEVGRKYPERFLCCGLADTRKSDFLSETEELIRQGFQSLAIPAHRLVTDSFRVSLTSGDMMRMFRLMEEKGIILSLCLADDASQIAEIQEVIAEYPNLKIAIGHFGMAGSRHWKSQIALAANKNVMIESGGITWLYNAEFYPFEGAVKAIREAADMVGIEKLMWGSDYPRTITAITYKMSYDFIIKSRLLTENEKSLFLGKNAERFYGFKNLKKLPYIKNMSE